MEDIVFSSHFPPPPARLFLVGIGGIGMSGLAQFLKASGYEVAGSDRGLSEPARQFLFRALEAQGIPLFPQDGSGPASFHPEGFVFTTAIEPGNPDALAAPDLPVFHRAMVLSRLCERNGGTLLGVAGTCGKTSVAGWLGAALKSLGRSVTLVNGGYLPELETPTAPGNFYRTPGCAKTDFVVAEIDESDRSIAQFAPEFGVVLNVGDDHYSTEELQMVFRNFLSRCKRGALRPENLPVLAPEKKDGRQDRVFSGEPRGYQATPEGIRFLTPEGREARSRLSGRHNALNGLAVYEMLRMALPDEDPQKILEAMASFQGVRQRFEVFDVPVERRREGVPLAVVNDYAHNPEKIAAAITAARERFGAPLGILFQPHGFGALRFMEDALREQLSQCLHPGDRFLMLPVYYAGGTVSFSPTSAEVAERFRQSGVAVEAVSQRAEAEAVLRAGGFRAWMVLGARDASLREWSKALSETPFGKN